MVFDVVEINKGVAIRHREIANLIAFGMRVALWEAGVRVDPPTGRRRLDAIHDHITGHIDISSRDLNGGPLERVRDAVMDELRGLALEFANCYESVIFVPLQGRWELAEMDEAGASGDLTCRVMRFYDVVRDMLPLRVHFALVGVDKAMEYTGLFTEGKIVSKNGLLFMVQPSLSTSTDCRTIVAVDDIIGYENSSRKYRITFVDENTVRMTPA